MLPKYLEFIDFMSIFTFLRETYAGLHDFLLKYMKVFIEMTVFELLRE